MKTAYLAITLLMATLVSSGNDALAAHKTTTVSGILNLLPEGAAMLKGATGSDKNYQFTVDSEAGKKIMSICQTGKLCVVRGVINGDRIINAYYVSIGQ